jgi:putative DNA primase/helicase
MGDWTDLDTIRTQSWLADRYALDVGTDTTLAGVSVVADRHRFHPVRDWLSSLRWDGQKRLPTWLHDVFGCPNTPFHAAIGQAWAISAIARAFRPGCKVDTVLVLEGDPGIRKSSVLRVLFGDEWFLEVSIADVANKDAMQLLKRKWGAEFPEIDGLSKTEQSHVKAYFSRQVDTYRPSYGKGTRDFPRQIVFAATTNKEQYLTDETGGTGRRMWPARCSEGDIALASQMRDQFWAEAVARFESGEEWHIRDPGLRDAERSEQDARFRTDPWEQSVGEWLAKPIDLGKSRSEAGVTTADVLAGLGVDPTRRKRKLVDELASVNAGSLWMAWLLREVWE